MSDGNSARTLRAVASHFSGRINKAQRVRRAAGCAVELLEQRQLMTGLPSGWSDNDIGSPAFAGGATYDGTAFDVAGGGSDISGTGDQFNLAGQNFTGDGSIVAKVTSQTDTNTWAKAGLMFRNDTSAGSAFAAIFATPGQGVSFQWRSSADADGSSDFTDLSGVSVPTFLKLTRVGDSFTAYYSSDGSSWAQVCGSEPATIGSTALTGLAVTSHDNSQIGEATFANVSLTAASSLPTGWSDGDVGSPAFGGSADYDGSTYAVSGGGWDISGTSDQFNFASQNFTGDGSMVAQITSQTDTNTWAKAGVMFRTDTSAGSAFAAIFATPGQGVSFQWRTSASADGSWDFSVTSGVSVPTWLKLTRVGDSFTAYYSADGTSWTQVGGTELAAVGSSSLAGLAVTSHDNSQISQATFANVSLTAAPGLPSGWSDGDIGSPQFAGSAEFDGSTFTVTGDGSDIYGSSDQFNFASQSISGDANIIADVTSQTDTDSWAKAGVMFRNDSSAGSAFAAMFVTPGQGVSFQWRGTANADNSGDYVQLSGISAPTWLKLSREGDSFSAYYSDDGASWIQVGGSETASVGTTALAGLAVTAHNNSALSQAAFTNVSINSTLILTSDTTISNSGSPLTINEDIETAGYTLTLSGSGLIAITGAIDGSGSVVMNGSGTLTITSPNTYTGTTCVDAGTLLLANVSGSATGTGDVTVESGATLAGTGTAGGMVTIDSGGTLSPGIGTSVGVLNTGDLILDSGSNLDIIINSNTPGSGFSQVQVTGSATITGSNLVLSGTQTSTDTADLNILVVTNTVTGTFSGDTTLNDVTYTASYIPGAGNGVGLTTGTPFTYEVTLGEGTTGSTVFNDTDTLHVASSTVTAFSAAAAVEMAIAGSVYVDQSAIGNGVLGPFDLSSGNIVIRNDVSPDRRRLMPSELGLNNEGSGNYSGYLGLNDDSNLANNDNDYNDRIWAVGVTQD